MLENLGSPLITTVNWLPFSMFWGYLYFLKLHILFCSLLPAAVIPLFANVIFEGSPFYSCIGMWSNHSNSEFTSLSPPALSVHIQFSDTYNQYCLQLKYVLKITHQTWLYCRSEIINTAKEISHSAFSVSNSCQLLATTYLQGMSSPLPAAHGPWHL